MNVTNDQGASSVTFQYKKPGSSSFTIHETKTSVGGNTFVTSSSFTAGSGDYGDYEFKVNTSASSDNATITGVTLDGKSPTVDSKSPSGDTNDEDPTVSYSASDSDAGVDTSTEYIQVLDEDDDEVDAANDTSVDVSDLNDGETYTVKYEVADKVGNWNNDSWTFTVDTDYDGDTSPSLDWESSVDDGVMLMDDDEDLTIGYNDDDEEPDEVTCYEDYEDSDDKGDKIDDDTSSNTEDNEYQFKCTFDENDYEDEEVDLTVEACDAAGNCDAYDAGTFTFDASPPSIIDLSTSVSVVNGKFPIDFTATDVSGLEELEYFFDSDTDKGDGTNVNISDDTEEFDAEVSDLDEGDQTIYVRVKDGAGRWSDKESLDFEYLPDATPSVSLTAPSSLNVTAGDSKSFTVTVENSGDLLVSGAELTVKGKGVDANESVKELYPDESEDFSFDVSPKKADIGSHTIDISTTNPSASETVDLRVLASEDQKSSIESKLSDYRSKLEGLKTNVSSLKARNLPGELKNRLDSNYSSFKKKVDEAENAVSSGKYYKAETVLEGIDSSYLNAANTYDAVKKQYRKGQQQQMLMMGIVGLAALGALGAVFFWRSEEYDLHLDRIADSDISVGDLEGLKSRVSSIFKSEEEAEEFEWNGFN